MNTAELSSMSKQVRRDIINMTANAGSGHPGGSLSAADLMTCLFFNHMHVDPKHPDDPNRDRFVLSKGHAAPCYYAVLAEMGFISRDEFKNSRQLHSILQGHPDSKKVPGVDASTGSLGQGCSIAVGMALGAKLSGYSNTVYAVMGDGEIQEGQFWEACMYAGAHKLGNLIGIVDSNKIQLDGRVSEVLDTGDLQAKFEAFGFFVQSIDGHDVAAISDAIDRAKAETGRASMIIANTVKGKGVSFMENTCKWHGRVPTDDEFAAAFEELYQRKAELEG